MKKLLEYFKKRLEIRKLISLNKPDSSSKTKQKTIPINPKLYSDLDFKGYTNPAKTFNKNTLPKPKGVK